MKKLSIIIPVLRSIDIKYTELCVESLRRNSQEHHEVILAINPGIDTESYKHISADIIFGSELQGQCHGNNESVKRATNEWIMIADNDTVFPKNWEKCLEYLEPDIVLSLNSMEFNPRGSVPGFILIDCGKINDFDIKKFENEAELHSEEKFMPGFVYPFLMEKKHYEAVDGFDEKYDPWGSTCDSDFRYKLMLYGLNLKRYSGVVCYHFSQVSGAFDPTEEMDYFRKGNRRYFETKWQLAQAPSPQIWYSEFRLPIDKIPYKPEWVGKISSQWFGKEEDNQYWECSECRYHNFLTRQNCLRCNHEK